MCSSINDTELLVGLSYSSLGTICKVCGCPHVSTRVEKWQAILVFEGTTIPEIRNTLHKSFIKLQGESLQRCNDVEIGLILNETLSVG